jgi:cell division protein FtsW (lipid II flippase)
MAITRRWTELRLLLLCDLFLLAGLLSLRQSGTITLLTVEVTAISFSVLFLVAHLGLLVLLPEGDQLLLPLTAMLAAIGVVFITRLNPDLASRQLLWLGVGIVLFLVSLPLLQHYARLRNYQYIAAFAGLGLMLVTAVIGKQINGSRLWLGFGGYYFQVTEAMKLLLVLFLAGYLADRRLMLSAVSRRWRAVRVPTLPYLIPLGIIWLLTLSIMAWQHDLGAMMLLMAVTLLLLYVATNRLIFVIGGLLVMVLNLYLAYHLFAYVKLRIDLWLHPLSRVHDEGYQMAQSLYAFASGGVFGTGLGHGFPTYIPAVHTDFIFAAVGEEFGLIGAAALMLLYLLYAFRGLRISLRQPTDYGTLLALGCTAIFAFQSMIIMAGNLGAIPITGITLPFISYGGSSVAINFVLLAILLRLSSARAVRRASPRSLLSPNGSGSPPAAPAGSASANARSAGLRGRSGSGRQV